VIQANEIVTSGAADLVFIGREMLRDPYWAIHAAQALGKQAPWPTPYGYAVEPRKR
jgi:2,4-dienoyl-CoA reductase-like NADH-dependent reductase (Old Yellow Enzyme family)